MNKELQMIWIESFPNDGGKLYKVQPELINNILDTFKSQNATPLGPLLGKELFSPEFIPTSPDHPPPPELTEQEKRCKKMQDSCPEGSKDTDPILFEDWCDEIPFKEFVKNDTYLSQCYRLTSLLKAFQSQLESIKGDNPFPQWPNDPILRTALSPEKLNTLYEHARDAEVNIPEIFEKFMWAMNSGKFDVKVAMAGPYIGTTDQIEPKYMDGYIVPAVETLYKKSMTQEERDLELALYLAEQL